MVSAFLPRHFPPPRFDSVTKDPRARRIIEAAYDLLDESGLEGLTIRAVLARTGLARRAFYECFSGKDDLVLAVFEATLHLAAECYRTLIMPGCVDADASQPGDAQAPHGLISGMTDPLEGLALLVTSIGLGAASPDSIHHPGEGRGDGNRRNAALAREHLRLADTRPDELHLALAPLLALIAELLRAGIATGQIRPCDPDRQAMLIYNLVSTTIHTELIADETLRPDPDQRLRLANELWDFCRRAIIAER